MAGSCRLMRIEAARAARKRKGVDVDRCEVSSVCDAYPWLLMLVLLLLLLSRCVASRVLRTANTATTTKSKKAATRRTSMRRVLDRAIAPTRACTPVHVSTSVLARLRAGWCGCVRSSCGFGVILSDAWKTAAVADASARASASASASATTSTTRRIRNAIWCALAVAITIDIGIDIGIDNGTAALSLAPRFAVACRSFHSNSCSCSSSSHQADRHGYPNAISTGSYSCALSRWVGSRSLSCSHNALHAPAPAPPRLALPLLHVSRSRSSTSRAVSFKLAELATPVGAWFNTAPSSDDNASLLPPVSVTLTRANVEQDATHSSLQTYVHAAAAGAAAGAVSSGSASPTQADNALFQPIGTPIPLNVVAYVPSPSRTKVFVVREHVNKAKAGAGAGAGASDVPAYAVEVLDTRGQVLVSVLTRTIHGRIHKGATIGSIAWNNREDAVAYIADPLTVSGVSFFESPVTNGGEAAKTSAETRAGAAMEGRQFDWKEEWGEVLGGTSQPRACVLTWASSTPVLSVVPGIPSDVSIMHAVWTPSDDGLAVVAVAHAQRRLGLAFYNSRPSSICYLPVTAVATAAVPAALATNAPASSSISAGSNMLVNLTPRDHSASAPRFSPDGKWLIYSTTDNVWMHASCCRVRKLRWAGALDVLAREQVYTVFAASNTAQIHGSSATPAGASSSSLSVDPAFRDALAPLTSTLVNVVDRPATVHSFAGLWQMLQLFKHECWLPDSRHVVLSSQWRARDALLVLDTSSGTLFHVPPPFDGSVRSFGEHAWCALVGVSSPTRPAAVYIVQLRSAAKNADDARSSGDEWQSLRAVDCRSFEPAAAQKQDTSAPASPFVYRWVRVSDHSTCTRADVQQRLEQLRWSVMEVDPKSSDAKKSSGVASSPGATASYQDLPFDSILLTSGPLPADGASASADANAADVPSSTLPRLVAFPHGGPHSAFTTWFSYASAFVALARFAVLHINYRGSTGYGMANLASLPGKCGDQDVRDCMQAVDAVAEQRPPIVRSDAIAVMGGSHGGFLTCHLIGQHPDRFASAVVRNPVVNCAAMAALTDIPDWCFFETGLPYAPGRAPTAADYAHLFAASPIAHLSNVRTPLLLLLGTADRRVPPQQAIDYYRLLRARGVPTRCLVYPDAQHSLTDKLSQESDVWVNSLAWMVAETAQGDGERIDVALRDW